MIAAWFCWRPVIWAMRLSRSLVIVGTTVSSRRVFSTRIGVPSSLSSSIRANKLVWRDFQSWSNDGTLMRKFMIRRWTSVGTELDYIGLTIVIAPVGQG